LKNSYKNKIIVLSGVFVILLTVIIAENFTLSTASKGTDVCMSCHEDESLTMERDGKIVPIYVNDDHYKKSVIPAQNVLIVI
jgi:hypothetical protein